MKEPHYPAPYAAIVPARLSWGPVFAGASIAFVAMACLSLLGSGAGILAASAAATEKGGIGAGAGAGLWLTLSGLFSYYAGGWITGRMMAGARDLENVIHGLLCWATATLVFLLMCSVVAGPSVGGALGAMGLQTAPVTDVRRSGERIAPSTRRAADASAKAAGTISLLGFLCFAVEGMGAGLGAYAGGRGWSLPVMMERRRNASPTIR